MAFLHNDKRAVSCEIEGAIKTSRTFVYFQNTNLFFRKTNMFIK